MLVEEAVRAVKVGALPLLRLVEALQAHFLQPDRQGPETPVVQEVLVLLALLEIPVILALLVVLALLLLDSRKHFPAVLLVMVVLEVMAGLLVTAVLVVTAAAVALQARAVLAYPIETTAPAVQAVLALETVFPGLDIVIQYLTRNPCIKG